MRYISDDNKVFNSEQECLEYEKVLNEEKIKREKLIAEKNKRKDEVVAAYDNFMKLSHKFTDDYKEPLTFDSDIADLLYPFNKTFPRRIWNL